MIVTRLLRAKIFVVVFLLVVSLSTLSANGNESIVVAQVNDRVITLNDLRNRVEFLRLLNNSSNNFYSKIATYNTLDTMIREEMLRQEAVRVGIDISEFEISDVLDRFRHSNSRLYTKLSLKRNKKYLPILREGLRNDLLWNRVIAEVVKPALKSLNDPYIVETLEELGHDVSESKYNISQIIIPNSDSGSKKSAQDLYDLLTTDDVDDVEKFLRKFNKDFDKDIELRNIGWVSKSDIDDRVYKMISDSKSDTFAAPYLNNDFYIIIVINNEVISQNITKSFYRIAKSKIYESSAITEGEGFLRDLRKRTFVEMYYSRVDKYFNY